MQQQLKQVAVDEKTEDSSLLDCYRIAIDFGMAAALKAYEKLAIESSPKDDDLSIKFDN